MKFKSLNLILVLSLNTASPVLKVQSKKKSSSGKTQNIVGYMSTQSRLAMHAWYWLKTSAHFKIAHFQAGILWIEAKLMIFFTCCLAHQHHLGGFQRKLISPEDPTVWGNCKQLQIEMQLKTSLLSPSRSSWHKKIAICAHHERPTVPCSGLSFPPSSRPWMEREPPVRPTCQRRASPSSSSRRLRAKLRVGKTSWNTGGTSRAGRVVSCNVLRWSFLNTVEPMNFRNLSA